LTARDAISTLHAKDGVPGGGSVNSKNPAAKGIGARLPRKEDERHLYGRSNFVGDIHMPGLQEIAFLRSPLAHARIRSIRFPVEHRGRIFTAAEIENGIKPVRTPSGVAGMKFADYPALAVKKVRMVGEPIAMCVAPSRAEAEDLCELVRVDLEEVPAVVDAIEARRPGAPLVHEEFGDNLFLTTQVNAKFDEAARSAPVVVKREIRLARQCMSPMEGKGALGYWDRQAEQLVLYTSTQAPHIIRTALAEYLGIEEGVIRVIAPDVGGGFGGKSVLQPEELLVAWLALTTKQPVRWTEDRREHLIAAANAREHHYVMTAYADRRGRILALDAEITVSAGAYSAWPVSVALEALHAQSNLPGCYDVRGYRCKTFSVATNKAPVVPYRGVAKPGVGVAMELTLDAVAHAVGREPADVRLENLIPAAAMPFNTITGGHYDSGDYPGCLRTAMEHIGLTSIRARQKTREADGRLIGVGFSTYTETTALGTRVFVLLGWPFAPGLEQANLRITPDGGLEIRVGIQSHGQGSETTLAQVAYDVLGIDPARIKVVHGDTALTPYSTGTYDSRTMVMAGGAVAHTARVLAERVKRIGAHLLQCRLEETQFEEGMVRGPRGQVSIREIAATSYYRPDQLPADVDRGGLEATVGYKPKVESGAIGCGAHAALVAVDPESGSVEILDYVVVEDCGTIVNPMIVEGQAYGGTAQGIGTALYEEMPFDSAGQPLASTFADYLLPGASEMPPLRIIHMESPSPYTEYGIKGVGEAGTIGAPGAILSALNDALRPLGTEILETPATPRRVLEAIMRAKAREATA
jgi:carbon-monoxide dehydrogenase large subunit